MKQIVDNCVDKSSLKDKCDDQSDEEFDSNISDNEDDNNDNHFVYLSDNEVQQMSQVLTSLKLSDTKALRRLAKTADGFINDSLRQQIWPKVSKLSVIGTSPRPDTDTIESHPFYNQVVMDVNRSLKRFPPSIDTNQRISMQDSLIRLIMRVLIKNPDLNYFQGYHDICVTFLMVLGEEMAFYVVNQLSKTHFRVYMEKTMEKTQDLLDIIPIVVREENKTLSEHLERSEVGTIFALSWVITWFSHVLPTYEDVTRLFDFFLVSHSLMPFYLTVAILLYKQNQILDTDCDMPSVHQFLTRIPETEELPIEMLIESAMDLIRRYPPNDMIRAQERAKKLRQKAENSRNVGLFSKMFDLRYLFNTFTKFNFMSITIVIVLSAAVFQFYRNI
ncbi:TBC1 domain family member 20-like [Oppia nitens]|uniref:TBC1 domain family member 20-like n=1 Tax=Oppia nitens TaxID=1686743 RepID=UPI0023DAC79D|nr:TBC1 domain family member 20-like [Oppia nitens]